MVCTRTVLITFGKDLPQLCRECSTLRQEHRGSMEELTLEGSQVVFKGSDEVNQIRMQSKTTIV